MCFNIISLKSYFPFQVSSLHKQRDEQDAKEASTFQFKNTVEARYESASSLIVQAIFLLKSLELSNVFAGWLI